MSTLLYTKSMTMNRKISMMFIALAISGSASFAQVREIPKAVEETFSQQYNGATNIDYKDQLVRVDVHFELNGEKMIASYSNKGRWKETEKEWTYDKLPDEIKDGFQKSK